MKTLAAELTRTHGLAPDVAASAAVVVDRAASNWDRWRFVIRILPIDDIEACAAEAARILQLAGYTIPESTVMA
jgi:hypothetical protein